MRLVDYLITFEQRKKWALTQSSTLIIEDSVTFKMFFRSFQWSQETLKKKYDEYSKTRKGTFYI